MTSQGPHHDDDLVRHLIAAEERLSRDPMQTDVSEVEDLQVTAGMSSGHNSQMMLTNNKFNATMSRQKQLKTLTMLLLSFIVARSVHFCMQKQVNRPLLTW